MNYIISENKVYESTPPFKEVGEITEGPVIILTLNEEVKTRRTRKQKESTPEIHTQE